MKFLKIGDLHIGVKQDDPWIQNIQLDGINQMIKYSKENGITVWLQAGDFADTRKAITHKCMSFSRKIVDAISDAGITVYTLVGNHDMHNKEKIHPNFCNEFLSQFNNFKVIDKPTTIDLGVEIDLIPWICNENQDEITKFIKNSKSEYCMGHFELNGFYFYKGMKSHGTEPDFLKNYKKVWSGHFHTISENKNVCYIGTPWTLTAGDENDQRGFWEFDTDTKTSKFIKNTTTWHRKIYYPGTIDVNHYKNLSVRVVVTELDKDFTKLESALEGVVHELKVIQKFDNSTEFEISDEDVEIKSLVDLINDYIDESDESDEDKKTLKFISKELYLGVL